MNSDVLDISNPIMIIEYVLLESLYSGGHRKVAMFVLGTAGHVDHGKSVLVHALTGIDPDRLREEKERGMTIELGFAWLRLPSGKEVSIVDVPGHERFINNMLSGVGGIDLALLVVAADEGVMPQTREHLAILDLLRVERGIVVITKKDLVDEEWLELVAADIAELVKGTALSQAPIVPVSAVTGDCLSDLVSAIDNLLDFTSTRKDKGSPRIPIDRVFTMVGFGTVVTGTLIDGELNLGQKVEILPQGLETRIRGLQTHKRKLEVALPGSRVAVNLVGVATEEIERGQVLTTPDWLTPTRALDVSLRLLASRPRPLPHNATVTFHTGSCEVTGKVRLLDRDKLGPGDNGWAQIVLTRPVAVVKGDLFVIRSANDTLGGGEIVDPYARRHRRFHPSTIASLEARARGSPKECLVATLETGEPVDWETLALRAGLDINEAKAALEELASENRVVVLSGKGQHSLIFSAVGWRRIVSKAEKMAREYHRQFPIRHGLPREHLKSGLKVPATVFAGVLQKLLLDGVLVEESGALRLPSHQIQPTSEQRKAIESFLQSLAQNPYSPPSDHIPDPELLNLLIEQGQVVKVSDNVVLAASAYSEMVGRVKEHIASQGKITLAEVRDLFQTSRKYSQALMEYLDARGITRRIGDERVLK
jgi:selenocysteine-specific elongation factor